MMLTALMLIVGWSCLLSAQDTYYEQSAKLLAEASGQMQQEVRNLFPTAANTGVISHHHAPPAASWDAAADATIAAKEADLEARRRWVAAPGMQSNSMPCCFPC